VGIRVMGHLMNYVVSTVDPHAADAPATIREHLALVAPHCRWTADTWEELGLPWNGVENVPHHLRKLSNYLIRTYMDARAEKL
jgi:hypothetical protein